MKQKGAQIQRTKASDMDHELDESSSSEGSPFLAAPKPVKKRRPVTHTRTSSLLSEIHVPQTHSPKVVVVLVAFLIFVVMIGVYFMMIPMQRIYEDIICRHYYDGLSDTEGHIGLTDKIDEELCKVDAVQEELATVIGVGQFIDCIPGLILSFPLGMLADRWGRKRIFGLSVGGIIAAQIYQQLICWFFLPLRFVWISSVFLCIGGGQTVLQNMIYATLSDISTDATRANSFFAASTGTLLAEIIAPSAAAFVMKKTSPWVPYISGTIIMIIGACVMFFIPETLRMHTSHGHITENTPSASRDVSPTPSFKPSDDTLMGRLSAYISKQLARFRESSKIFKSTSIIILLFCFIIHPLLATLTSFFSIYLSRRYHLELADTGYILSYRAVINVIVLLGVLPGISYLLTYTSSVTLQEPRWYAKFQLGLSTRHKDLVLARSSLIFLIVGGFLLGSSPRIAGAVLALTLWTFGTGFSSLCRSLITTLVDQAHVGRLYAAISVIETFGLLGAGPMFSAFYSWGLNQASKHGNQAWIGAPLFAICASCLLFGLGVWFIRLPQEEEEGVERDNQEAEDLN